MYHATDITTPAYAFSNRIGQAHNVYRNPAYLGGQTASGINAKSVVDVNNAVQTGGFTQASALGLDEYTLGGFSFAGLDARDSFTSSSLLANASVNFIHDVAVGLNGINISAEPVNNIEALSSVERYSKLALGGLVGVADLAVDTVKAAFVGLGTVTGSTLYRTTGLDYFSGLDNDLGAFLSGTVDFVSSDNPQDLVFATLENTLNEAYALSFNDPFAAGRIYGELGSGTALGILDAAALATKAPVLLSKAGQGLNSTFNVLNSSTTRLLDTVFDTPLFGSPVAQAGHVRLDVFGTGNVNSLDNIGGMFRRTENVGEFADLQVTMNLKTVKSIAKQSGVGLNGVKIKIIRDPELIGKNVFGFTHPNGRTIDLYPDAFSSPENLVRTLGHERTHIYQFKTLGAPKGTDELLLNERAAYRLEDSFVKYFKYNGGSL